VRKLGPSWSRRRAAIGLLLILGLAVFAATALAAPKKKNPPAPPLQAMGIVDHVNFQLPAGFTMAPTNNDTGEGNGGVELAPDDKHLVAVANFEEKSQIGVANFDGSEFKCLTCGLSNRATKPTALEDGKRIWFSDNAGGGLGEQQWAILECAPSIYDCQEAKKVDVKFPIDSIFEGTGAQNREAKPDPYGEVVAWNEVGLEDGTKVSIAKLVRNEKEYELVDQRIVSPQFSTESNNVEDWVNGGRFYEGGDFEGGNRWLKYQTTRTGLNYETTLLNLQTGEHRFITTDLDYNELGNYSPDAKWTFYSSARGLDRMNVFTQLVRPSFLDFVAFGQVGRVSLWNNRRCMNEMWLMNAEYAQRRGGYAGEPVILDNNWNIRRVDWFEEGKRALITETRIPNQPYPTDPEQRTRTVVVNLPAIKAHKPPKLLHVNWSAVEQFSVPASEYKGMAARQVSNKTIPGPGGGTVTFNFQGTLTSGTWKVAYNGFSMDGKTFIDGTEELLAPNIGESANWKANLTERGEHKGYLSGDLVIKGGKEFTGTVESEVDGVKKSGVPTQETCPGLYQPKLRVRALKKIPTSDGRVRVVAVVESQSPEDRKRRPVAGARVTLGGAHARTDWKGRVNLIVRPKPGLELGVKSAGYKGQTHRVSGLG
jgi:hypothetical protein